MLQHLYISTEGRCSRRHYWIFGVIPFVAMATIVFALAAWLRFDPSPVFFMGIFFFLWPAFAMQIKRWHDLGQSGLFCLLTFVPLIGFIICIVIGLIPGNVGENRFGADPLADTSASKNAL